VKVLVVGSGAREHALAWRLAQSTRLTELHAAPGNPGIATLGTCHPVRAGDGDGLLALALTLEIDLAVIGPEAPLVAGVADLLRQNGVGVFGPSAEAARIASVTDGYHVVALDERGQSWTTAKLAAKLAAWRERALAVAFVIGSADGLDPGLKHNADAVLALSALTLPHGLARVVLAEQLYRATSMLSGHPYHRE